MHKKLAYYATAWMPTKFYLRLRYRITFGKKLNLKKPKTYNEKLQWMKVYDHNPIYHKLVDKFEVREHVARELGEEYLIPLIGMWDKFDDIDFGELPDQFVMKCTHDSGSVFICKDKNSLDLKKLKKQMTDAQKRSQYRAGREWSYKGLKPRIIAEKFMVDDSCIGLKDYKFFCFNGEVKAMFIATDRGVEGEDVKFDFFDADYNHLSMKHGHENAKVLPPCPEGFEEMKTIASKLSQGLRQVRVDLYNINGKIYFGEMTFYHHCGFVPFEPEEWDYTFGSWLDISDLSLSEKIKMEV